MSAPGFRLYRPWKPMLVRASLEFSGPMDVMTGKHARAARTLVALGWVALVLVSHYVYTADYYTGKLAVFGQFIGTMLP